MTNAEKYLKDNVSVEELGKGIDTIYLSDDNIANIEQATIKFFSQEATPTLTEDERVILRNIPKEYEYISKQIETGDLFITEKKDGMGIGICIYEFNHLFQFIKERRRIQHKRIVRR